MELVKELMKLRYLKEYNSNATLLLVELYVTVYNIIRGKLYKKIKRLRNILVSVAVKALATISLYNLGPPCII